ncbi:hypothetical protein HY573_01645 [Candidatus Parcubacteria bacterium]|nr:hypothetical protein [Candidatus Parcubacteria bacterium]
MGEGLSFWEYVLAVVVGGLTLAILVGYFGYLLFTVQRDVYEIVSFALAALGIGYVVVRNAVAVWRRRSRRVLAS